MLLELDKDDILSPTPNLKIDTEDVNSFTNSFWWIFSLVNIDIDYARWLGWLFTPIIISFILPFLILFFLYLSALFLVIYKWHR